MFRQLQAFGPLVVRVGAAAVLIWFGVEQLTNSSEWIGWLPSYATRFIAPETLILVNGTFETAFGLALLAGFHTRIAAGFLSLHMIHILTVVGYGEIAVRDFGLFAAILSVFLTGSDRFTFDYYREKRRIERT